MKITSSPVDLPLYEVLAKARPVRGSTVEVVIKTEEEARARSHWHGLPCADGCCFALDSRRLD